MDAVDSYIPEPVRDLDKPFLMPIEDVFTITGRGTVVTGRVERGQVKTGETVDIIGIHDKKQTTTVTGIFRQVICRRRVCVAFGIRVRPRVTNHRQAIAGPSAAKFPAERC